jgi:hypothetical protein
MKCWGRKCTDHGRRLQFESLEPRALLAANAAFGSDVWFDPAVWTAGESTGEQATPLTPGAARASQAVTHSFFAAQDAYLESGARVDEALLRVGASPVERTSYLLFNLTDLVGKQIESARLRLHVTEAGSGQVQVYQGTSVLWTERFLSPANAPTPVAALDAESGNFNVGDWVEFDVTDAIQGDGITNFILSMASITGDLAFSSREGAEAPQLLLSANERIAGDADGDSDVDGNDFLSWQRTLGSTVAQPGAGADGNASGVVDAGDLTVWRNAFGSAGQPIPTNSIAFFGATPDDTTFDHAAIQAAINANTSVYFPSGEYWINAKLTIPAGRTLYGPTAGPPAVIRVRHDTGTDANNYAFEIAGDGVTIKDLVIDKDFVDGSYGVGIIANGRKDITISGVEIRDYSVRYGIHLIECENFEIVSCYIHDFMMNQTNPGGTSADMIRDSPAGIRITRSIGGSIRDSRVHNIEVGALGRATISELVPSYGPQGYQSDCITLSDCSGIVVENNDLWNSGELVDVLVSDHCIVRNNTMQMAYLFAVKCIGSQNSTVTGNYLGDAAIGIVVVDHYANGQLNEQCTGNFIERNDIVNCGSRGIWNIAASSRLGYAISGIYVDNDASGNTVSNNDIYNLNGYLSQYIREGAGGNIFANNDGIADEYGPGGGGDAAILGSWTEGLTHPKELIALNRALVFFTHAEDDSANIAATAVTYGGRSMTRMADRLVTLGTRRVYVSAWILKQDAINTAASGQFNVTWNSTPDSVGYSSVFLENIYQKTPLYSHDAGGATSGNGLSTTPRATHPGDIVLYAATSGEPDEFTPAGGLIEGLELSMSGADATAGYKIADGDSAIAAVTHTNLGVGAIYMACLQKNPSVILGGQTVDLTTLGAFPNDGVNDAIILQNALNNPAYEEIYLPPGIYHFDRSVFIPSYKSVRGDTFANTEVRTMADITPLRIDVTTGSSISNLSFTRPQTSNSNNEIIRADGAQQVVLEELLISSSASRAPLINFENGGNWNTVSQCYVYDYQVIRSETSPEMPGLHTQVFGCGINMTDNSNLAILDCQVIQTAFIILPGPDPLIKGVYQASAIQAPVCDGGRIARNYITNTGQGIDTSGAEGLLISHNVIEQCHSIGIKLVNGSNNIVVEDNYLRTCGLTGIGLGSGVANSGPSYGNTIRNNTLVSIGKGVGLDFWDFNFTLSVPGAVFLPATGLESDRTRDNVIVNNFSYDNTEQRGIVMLESSAPGSLYPAINNLIQGNIARTGPAPEAPFGALFFAISTDDA